MNEPLPADLRRYTDGDLEACRGLWTQLTEAHRAIYEDASIGGHDPGRHFDRHIEKIGAESIWVAEVGGNIVGLMGLETEEDEMTIEPLVVAVGWRRRGIGRRFVEIAIEEAKRRGASFLSVRPVARNIAALKFFSSNGMTVVGHVELSMGLKDREWKDGLILHGIDLKY